MSLLADLATLRNIVKAIPFGKRLPSALYISRESLERHGGEAHKLVLRTCEFVGEDISKFQVIRLHLDTPRIGLLRYPTFLLDPHPILERSVAVDLESGKWRSTDYHPDRDPPILHRCEEFIEGDNPLSAALKALTKLEERYGLFSDPNRIGIRSFWLDQLSKKGLSYSGFSLVLPPSAGQPVQKNILAWESERQKSAIKRPQLSVPPRMLLTRGLLKGGDSYFDYGCGHGLDIEVLNQLGVKAVGWDPAHRPATPKEPADIVHCGYVLNVVEDPAERIAIIRDAWALSGRLLSIAVRVRAAESPMTGKPHGDGELTASGTFQKYFDADELPKLLEEVLGVPALALSPGIAVVARDEAILNESLSTFSKISFPPHLFATCIPDRSSSLNQSARSPDVIASPRIFEHSESVALRFNPSRESRNSKLAALIEEMRPVLVDLGRPPKPNEITLPAWAKENGFTPTQLWNAFSRSVGSVGIAEIAKRRTTEVLVFLAMAHFRRIPTLASIPLRIRNDLEVLCGGYRQAVKLANALLVSVGKPDVIVNLCNSFEWGVCDEQALFIHSSLLNRLDPILRIYIGCAEVLGAPTSEADIIKIHKQSRKVTLLRYQNFVTSPLPALIERIKVDLRARAIYVFDHRNQPRQLLYDRDMYVAEDHPRFSEWRSGSEALAKLIGPIRDRGPDHLELRNRLALAGEDPDKWVPQDFTAPDSDDHDDPISEPIVDDPTMALDIATST